MAPLLVIALWIIFYWNDAVSELTRDPGLGWHLKTGEWIFNHFLIPFNDPFLYEHKNWVSDQWLSDLIFYLIQSNFGWTALTGMAICVFFIPGFIVSPKLLTGSKSLYLAPFFISLFITIKLMSIHFILRPVLFSFIFFSLQYMLIISLIEEKKISKIQILSIIFGYILWANMHPSFFLGITLLVLFCISTVLDKRFSEFDVPHKLILEKTILLSFAALLVTFINPYGIELHKSILSLGSSEYFMNLNSEWLPLEVRSPNGKLCLWTITLISLGIFYSKKNQNSFTIIATFFFYICSLNSARFLPYFGIVSFPLVYQSVCIFINKFQINALQVKDTFNKIPVFIITFFFISSLFGYIAFYNNSLEPLKFSLIDKLLLKDSVSIIYNHPNTGGLITFCGNNKIIPVLDDRNYLVGQQAYQDYLSVSTWQDMKDKAKKYNAQYFLTKENKVPKDFDINNEIARSEGYVLYRID